MEKTKIKLEVGKSYKDREGSIIRIISYRIIGKQPYLGDDNYEYHEDGSFNPNKSKSDFDLIEEVTDITSTTTTTTDDDTTITTNPKGVYEVKDIAAKNSEVSKLEDSLREHICGLVIMGKYQEAKGLLNILVEEDKS